MPRRYEALHRRLLEETADEVVLPRRELEMLVVGGLPVRAVGSSGGEYWSNNPHRPQARAWREAGWRRHETRMWSASSRRGLSLRSVSFARGVTEGLDLDSLRRARDIRGRYALRQVLSSLRTDGRPPLAIHVRDGWWEPHQVYLAHFPDLGLRKVGVCRVGSRRLRDLGGGRRMDVVDTVTTSDRFEAELVEVSVLRVVQPWYDPSAFEVARFAGYTETWSDDGPSPVLARHLVDVRRDVFAALPGVGE